MLIENHDQFFAALSRLYENSREKGTVWITLKRLSYEKKPKRKEDESDEEMEAASKEDAEDKEHPCIVRAVSGKKKLSIVVQPSDADRFLNSLATVSRAHMDSLKKKERVKGAKKKKSSKKTPKSI